jgi:hypothetical protein
VVIAAACIAAVVLLARSSVAVLAIVPGLAAALILTSLVIVQPGHTKVVRFFGSYVGTVCVPACRGSCRWRTGRDCRLAGGRYLAGILRRR